MTDDRNGHEDRRLPSSKRPSSLARRQDQANRRAQALELRMSGLSYAEVGERLGIGESGAWRLIDRALEIHSRAGVAELRDVESRRLAEVERAVWPAAVSGDLAAVETWLKISARRSKLLGLDAPTRVEVSVEARTALDAAIADLERLVLGDLDETDRP